MLITAVIYTGIARKGSQFRVSAFHMHTEDRDCYCVVVDNQNILLAVVVVAKFNFFT